MGQFSPVCPDGCATDALLRVVVDKDVLKKVAIPLANQDAVIIDLLVEYTRLQAESRSGSADRLPRIACSEV